MFGKRLSDLNAADIDRLVAEAVPEDSELEFKETLPATGKGDPDPWLSGGSSIGDRARNELLAEVIAFANAYGGTLVLGIAETGDKPPRAEKVVPLPKCADLAERLRLQCRDLIEPQVPVLEVVGISTETDGSGVVVVRVPKSMAAPHRHNVTRECYARRADRSEKMTMREIRDLTLLIDRGLASVEERFSRRKEAFDDEVRARIATAGALAIRATALPLLPLFIERVHGNEAVQPPLVRFFGTIGGAGQFEAAFPARHFDWRPVLRGSRGTTGREQHAQMVLEVYCDGTIDYRVYLADTARLYVGWVMGIVASCLCGIEKFRIAAGAADVEYGLELEIRNSHGEPLQIGGYSDVNYGEWRGSFPTGATIFPRYSIGSRKEFSRLAQVFERDFWNASNQDIQKFLKIDFTSALAQLKL